MQLLGKMFRGLVVAFLALGFIALGPKSGFAFTNGQFNLIKIQLCESIVFDGFDFLVVVDSNSGGAIALGDAAQVLAVAPICHPGGQFFAFLNNGVVTNVSVVPGL